METVAETVVPPTDGSPAPNAPVVETPAQPNNQPPEWVTRRLGELAAQRRAAEQRAEQAAAENARLQQQLAQFQAGQQGDGSQVQHPNVEQLARTYAQQMLQQQQEQDQQQQQGARIAEVDAAARKEFGADYDTSVQNLTMAGVGGAEFLSVITNVSNPGKLVTWLGKPENLGEAARLMSMNPVQMGVEMERLSGRAVKEMGKQVSKAPPPVEGVSGGGGGDAGGAEPKVGSAEWFEWRNKNARRGRR